LNKENKILSDLIKIENISFFMKKSESLTDHRINSGFLEKKPGQTTLIHPVPSFLKRKSEN
jgi:hypothetical protein